MEVLPFPNACSLSVLTTPQLSISHGVSRLPHVISFVDVTSFGVMRSHCRRIQSSGVFET